LEIYRELKGLSISANIFGFVSKENKKQKRHFHQLKFKTTQKIYNIINGNYLVEVWVQDDRTGYIYLNKKASHETIQRWMKLKRI